MAKFTIHNEHNDFLHKTFRSLESAKSECDNSGIKCKVFETYYKPSPFKPWSKKLTEHGREVYRNY